MTTETTIPTLTTVNDAKTTLDKLAAEHEWVSVFWDRGWGDNGETADITIIVDGDGQEPKARLTPEVYVALRDQRIIGENCYGGYKKRRLHDFKTTPREKRTGPTTNDIAEQAIRRFMDNHPDLPIVARFWRGLSRGAYGPQVNEEIAETPAARDGWYVLVIPGHSDAAISAQEPDFIGHRIIGGGVADCFAYPKTDDGEVDVEALAGEEFQALLAAEVEKKVAVIAEARAAKGER